MKDRDEKNGIPVNMGKTKIVDSGINLDMLKKSGKYPCGFFQMELVALMQSCGGYKRWVHKKNAVALGDPCALTLSI